ncbi:13950_t:CDS:2, partial [Cetraspora pellucida]
MTNKFAYWNKIGLFALAMGLPMLKIQFSHAAIISTKCCGSSRKRTSRLRRAELTTGVDSGMLQLQRDRELNIIIDDAHFIPQIPPPTYTRTINYMGLPPPYTSESNNGSVITSDYSSSIEEGTTQSTTSSIIQTLPQSYSSNLAYQT